jgi:ParB family chromosome partitioning protein
MASKILSTITELPVDDIGMENRLRPVSDAGVAALVASIKELGVMKDPIHVRKKKNGKVVLLAGGHRLTAAKQLEWDTIKVTCWECDDNFAELMEIDDNLAGAELTALDTAVFLARRKRVFEAMHPEMAQGGFRGNQHTGNLVTDIVSFTTATAEKFGLSDRHVRRLVAAGDALGGQDINLLRSAPKAVGLNDLMELAKIQQPSERYRVVQFLSQGEAKSASEARKKYQAEEGNAPVPLNNTDSCYSRLQDAWTRAPKAARVAFLEECGDDVAALLAEISGEAE